MTYQPLSTGACDAKHLASGGCDPYLIWAEGSNYIDYNQSIDSKLDWLLMAFELIADESPSLKAVALRFKKLEAFLGVDASHFQTWWSANHTGFGTALIKRSALPKLITKAGREIVKRFEVSLMAKNQRSRWPEMALFKNAQSHEAVAQSTTETLFGIIDFGCPFAHHGLRDASGNGTQILSIWNQSNVARLQDTNMPPTDYGFGSEYSRDDLNAYMTASGGDEQACYRKAGFTELASRASHGAHMLGLMVDGQKSPHDIVFVQLTPQYLQSAPSPSFGAYRLAGMHYILSQAGKNTKRVIIPISSESRVGPHDGGSLTDAALDALIEFAYQSKAIDMKVIFCVGNHALAKSHKKLEGLKANVTSNFKVQILPNNEMTTFVEIWLPKDAPQDIEIALKSPSKVDSGFMKCGAWSDNPANPSWAVVYQKDAGSDTCSRCIMIRIAPTLVSDSSQASAVYGAWTIQLQSESGTNLPIWAYIARASHGIGGKRRGYDAYFPDETIDYLASREHEILNGMTYPPNTEGSISGLACGNSLNITVASGYRKSDETRVRYAAKGESRGGRRASGVALVDVAARCDESITLHGIRSWGNASGDSIRMSGTSVAPPQVANRLAMNGSVASRTPITIGTKPVPEPILL